MVPSELYYVIPAQKGGEGVSNLFVGFFIFYAVLYQNGGVLALRWQVFAHLDLSAF